MEHPSAAIQLIGINQITHEGGNAQVSEGRDLPWLQDVDANNDGQSDVWLNSWPYQFRDVVIVDANNDETYNFSTPKEAIQVGNEIWVSDQIEDAVFIFDLAGNYLGGISLDDCVRNGREAARRVLDGASVQSSGRASRARRQR